jgi:hypothetical protein
VPPQLTPEQDTLVKRVREAHTEADKLHKTYRSKWETFYGLWRNWTAARNHSGTGNPRDWDPGLRNWAKREWGAELFIPMVFGTVETVLPKVISQRPRMLVKPRPLKQLPPEILFRLDENADNHQLLLDAQQEQIDYELILQDVIKDGLMYGLGIQETFWRKEQRKQYQIVPHIYTGEPCIGEYSGLDFDDNDAECVDPFDFFWDPVADSIKSCGYVIRRTWRNRAYVMAMLQSGAWQLDGLTEEDLRGGASQRYDQVWQQRMNVAGLSGTVARGELHEVWEFNTGSEIITVLDRQWPVQHVTDPRLLPWHGEIPFQVFRPTRVTHEMVGIGEVEPIMDLQQEINTLRSQRRDNATLKLMQSYAYQEGAVDPEDIKFGAGMLVPVRGIDPREVLVPLQVGDIPNSGYMEEDRLRSDFDRTSGVSDAIAGGDPSGGVSSTATGAQLVQAAANARIANKSRRGEVEIVKKAASQWLRNNQQHILARPVQKPMMPSLDEPDRRYEWVVLSPAELAGEFLVAPEGGSSAPENTPQDRQDAQLLFQMGNGNQIVDQQKLFLTVLRKMGVNDPQGMLAPPAPPPAPDSIPPEALDFLQKEGVPAQMIARAVQAAKADELRQQQGQPPMGAPPMDQQQPPQLPAPAGAGPNSQPQQ